MANIKELRGRIKSVGNIAKITKAMEMVASMKLRKVQQRALAAGPYSRAIRGLMGHLAEALGEDRERPLFVTRKVETTGVLLITSDRGLCGAYNTNVLHQVHDLEKEARAEDPNRKFKFYVYGKKGFAYLSRRGYDVERFYAEPPLDALDFNAARIVGKDLVEDFLAGKVDEVRVAATAFLSAARFEPILGDLLPVTPKVAKAIVDFPGMPEFELDADRPNPDYLLEPDPATLFELIVPKYLEISIFYSMLASYASEMASRRMAMKGATDAATRMGKELRMVYNRARQESITKELLDIVGGANAVA